MTCLLLREQRSIPYMNPLSSPQKAARPDNPDDDDINRASLAMTSMAGRVPRSRGSRCLRGTLTTEGKVLLLRRSAQPSRCIPSSAARMLSPISVPLANHLHFPCLSPGFVSHSAVRGWSACPCTPLPAPRRPAQGQDKVDKSVCYAETTESLLQCGKILVNTMPGR